MSASHAQHSAAPAPSLDEQVDTLLRDLDRASSHVEATVSDDAPPKHADEVPLSNAMVADSGVAPAETVAISAAPPNAAAEASQEPEDAAAAGAPTSPVDAVPPIDANSLDQHVDQLLDAMAESPKAQAAQPSEPNTTPPDASESDAAATEPHAAESTITEEPAAPAQPAAAAPEAGEAAEGSLASLTDSLLGADLVGKSEPEPDASPTQPASTAETQASNTEPAPAVATPPPPTKPDPAATAAKPPAPTPAPQHESVPHAAPTSTIPPPPPRVGIASRARRAFSEAGTRLAPALARVLAPASKPLASRPKIVRDTVGWMAIYTLFVGGSFWAYLLFFYKPPKPASAEPGIRLALKGEPEGAGGEVERVATGTEAKHGEEAAPEGGHAEAKGGEGHGEAKGAEGHGGEGHGGEGHGEAKGDAKKGAKPRPLPTIKSKLPSKKDPKKEPPKSGEGEGGHGEH